MLQDFIIHEYSPIDYVKPEDRWLDLIYGGTFRSGHRQDKMIEYYFNYPDNFNIQMFGNIKPAHFSVKKTTDMRFPEFISKKVKHREIDNIKPGGLGTFFIQEIMDAVEFKDGKKKPWINHLVLTKQL